MNVTDETTELVIVPFWKKDQKLKAYSQFATDAGKAELCKVIDNLEFPRSSNTYLNVPLSDFYNKRVASDPSYITYMFFMTDGEDEDKTKMFNRNLADWGRRYGNKDVYGFYVMLHKDAKNAEVERIINNQKHLWKVETADINIRLLRLDRDAIFNVRNEEYLDIPIHGNASGVRFETQLPADLPYEVKRTEVVINNLRVFIARKPDCASSSLPDELRSELRVRAVTSDEFTFLVTDLVRLTCKNQKEYTLKVSVR